MIIRQIILAALSLLSVWVWISYDYGGDNPTPLWMPALLIWITQSMFWLGWFVRDDLKLLIYLSGAWIGVMAVVATLGTFVAGGVAATGERLAIQAAWVAVVILPILLLPRFRPIWPGAEPPSSVLVHAGRSLFAALQYAGIGLLMLSLIQPPLADVTKPIGG